jgi:hypothetical protein
LARYAAGSSAGFSFAALIEFLRSVNWSSALALAGSIASRLVACHITHRSQLARAEIEREHQLRQAKRDEDLADTLAAIRKHQIEEG